MLSRTLSLRGCDLIGDQIKLKISDGRLVYTIETGEDGFSVTYHIPQGDRTLTWPQTNPDALDQEIMTSALEDSVMYMDSLVGRRRRLLSLQGSQGSGGNIPIYGMGAIMTLWIVMSFTLQAVQEGVPLSVQIYAGYILFGFLTALQVLANRRKAKLNEESSEITDEQLEDFQKVLSVLETNLDKIRGT